MATARFPVLFITASRVGDAVLTSGLIRRLSDEIPHARFTVVAAPLTAPLFRDLPNLDRLIPLEKEKASLHWFKLWRMVRGRRWGLIVDMRGSALSRFLNARRRAVRKSLPPGMEPVHKVIEAARVLRVEDEPPAPFLYTSAETEAAALAMLASGQGPILAMAPAANWVGKTWPAERFAVVAAELLAQSGPLPNGRLLLLGGPSDRFAAEAVRRVIPRARLIDAVGKVDLLTAYALLKHARLFIGNDSGLMHLSAAAGAPTLGLFGPSDERLYAPWGRKTRALRGPREFEVFKRIDPQLNQVVCHMFDLPTAWVTAAARKLLAETEEDGLEAPAVLPEPSEGAIVLPLPERQAVLEAPAEADAIEPGSDMDEPSAPASSSS
ncbi:glycosyltransferase family 9 protein [Caulobacter sp. S45]|uniref:glycosyltransferase family 9 protein n=1 Tax=Caulobacter sp. S45 TaxID=1641861 RepID=UPI00131C2021|nr:glycosyltransferase family 9 protein [Caulobacter sp. S45]